MDANVDTIEGVWFGAYGYRNNRPAVRFNAYFEPDDNGHGTFTGIIVEDSSLGDANAIGAINGRRLTLIKSYVSPNTNLSTGEITLRGEMTADGNSIIGEWSFSIYSGPWQLNRFPLSTQNARTLFDDPALKRLPERHRVNVEKRGDKITVTRPTNYSFLDKLALISLPAIVMLLMVPLLIFGITRFVERWGLWGLVYEGRGIFFMSVVILADLYYLARNLRIVSRGDAVVINRLKSMVYRNSQGVDLFSEFSCIELRPFHDTEPAKMITLVRNNGKRLFIETGRPAEIDALADDINQLTGIEIEELE
jgi:hypothetical protein